MQYGNNTSAFDSKKSFNVRSMSKSPVPKKGMQSAQRPRKNQDELPSPMLSE